MGYPTAISEVDWDGNPTSTYHDTFVYDDDVAAYWRFSDGSTLPDELGVSDGTLSGSPALVTGLLPFDSDQALQFDGVADYASVPSTSALQQSGSYTLLGRVKFPSTLPGVLKPLWTKGSLLLEIRSDGKLQFTVQNHVAGVSTRTTVVGTSVLQPDVEYTVICVHDAGLGELRIYVDGMREASTAHTAGTELWGLPLLFAARHSGTAPSFASVSAIASSSGGAACVVAKPAGTAVGDLLLVHGTISDNNQNATVASVPTGWAVLSQANPGINVSTFLAYKIADAGDVAASSFSFSFTGPQPTLCTSQCVAMRFTGVDPDNPFANPPYIGVGIASGMSTGAKYAQSDDVLALALVGQLRSVSCSSSDGTEMYDTGGVNSPGLALAGYYSAVATGSKNFTVSSNGTAGALYGWWLALKGPDAQDFCAVIPDEWVMLGRAFDDDAAMDAHEARLSGNSGWTDITADSRAFTTKRGRQYELNKIEAGTLTETLKDENRDYDPTNQSSPYYPNVIPKRRHRVRASIGGDTFAVFQGFVERWPPDLIAPGYQEVKITASDGFMPLAAAPVSGSIPTGLSGAQIHRLLDMAKWPRADRAIDDGVFIMADWDLPQGQFALASIQEIADGELGLFFVDAAGVATFHDYDHRWSASRSLTAQAVFSDDDADIAGGAIPYLRGGLVPSFDDDNTVTEWQVATAAGTVATVRDVVGARRSFPLAKPRTTRLSSIVDAEEQALALLQETARAGFRYDSLSPEPESDTDWQTVLGLEISDRVTVIEGGDTQDCFVEGVSVTSTPARWVVTLQLSPVSAASYYETILRDGPVSYYRMDGGG